MLVCRVYRTVNRVEFIARFIFRFVQNKVSIFFGSVLVCCLTVAIDKYILLSEHAFNCPSDVVACEKSSDSKIDDR